MRSWLCCCGEYHQWDGAMESYVTHLTNERGVVTPVTAKGRTWFVPRVYMLAHGLRLRDLPFLAAKYQWLIYAGDPLEEES